MWIYSAYDRFIDILLFCLQKYVEGKVGPDEKLPWVQNVIKKGFTGEIRLICSPIALERNYKIRSKRYSSIISVNYVMHLFKVKKFTLITSILCMITNH